MFNRKSVCLRNPTGAQQGAAGSIGRRPRSRFGANAIFPHQDRAQTAFTCPTDALTKFMIFVLNVGLPGRAAGLKNAWLSPLGVRMRGFRTGVRASTFPL